jgi:uncharacterized protein YbjT (DUF2867 family)
MRPLFVGDLANVLVAAALGDERIRNRTVAVTGPDELTFTTVVRRVAATIGRRPLLVPLPVLLHRLLAFGWEALMSVPLLSRVQVEILAETLTESARPVDSLPDDLVPSTHFTDGVLRAQLPPHVDRFGRGNLRFRG